MNHKLHIGARVNILATEFANDYGYVDVIYHHLIKYRFGVVLDSKPFNKFAFAADELRVVYES